MLLSGKPLARRLSEGVRDQVHAFRDRHGRVPCLAVLKVEHPGAPEADWYTYALSRRARRLGVECRVQILSPDRGEPLMEALEALAADEGVDGIVVQQPLPGALADLPFWEALPLEKDVDGVHPSSLGRLARRLPALPPATPLAGLALLRWAGVEIEGKRAVVVGRSKVVGLPFSLLLLHGHATVTVCHSRTRDLAGVVGEAEILAVAAGHPHLVRGAWVRPGAVVLDFGFNPLGDEVKGDVETEAAAERAAWVTPVPGGTGAVTNAALFLNLLAAARWRLEGEPPTLDRLLTDVPFGGAGSGEG